MSQSSQPGGQPPQRPPQTPRRLWLVLLSRPVLGTLLVLGVAASLLSWRLWTYINEELAPSIAQDLSESLDRPVELGEVQGISLTGLQFGPSAIPPHRRQVDNQWQIDRDSATVERVSVRFDLWKALWSRTLDLDVTLFNPQIYLNETAPGQWLDTTITQEDTDGWFQVQLKALRFQGGEAELQPLATEARTIQDLNGRLLFANQNQNIRIYGQGQLDSGGRADIEGEWIQPRESLSLNIKTQGLTLSPLIGFLPPIPFDVEEGQAYGTWQIQFRPQQPILVNGQGHVREADISIPEQQIRVVAERIEIPRLRALFINDQLPQLAGNLELMGAQAFVPENLILQNRRSQQLQVQDLNGELTFLDPSERVGFDLEGQLQVGGQLRAKGETTLLFNEMNFLLQAQNVAAPLLSRAYQLPIEIQAGQVDANLNIQLRDQQPPDLQGTAVIRNAQAQIDQIPQPFSQANGRLRFRGLTTILEGLSARYGEVPLRATGSIDPELGYALDAETEIVDFATALSTLQLDDLPFPITGRVQATNLQVRGLIDDPVLTGTVQTPGTPVLDQVPFEEITAQFRLAAPFLDISQIQAVPLAGGIITGAAAYNLTPGSALEGRLVVQNVPGNAIAQRYNADPGFLIGPVGAQVRLFGPPTNLTTQVRFQAPGGTYPTTGTVVVRPAVTLLQDIVAQVPGGSLQLAGQIAAGQLQATTTIPGIRLAAFSPELRGVLSGQLQLAGPIATLSADTIRAQGNVRFSEGIALIEEAIDAQIAWTGQAIAVQDASALGFRANGQIGAILQGPQAPQLTTLNLNVWADDYNLQRLGLGVPGVPLLGRADVQGRLTGAITDPSLVATLGVRDLAVSQVQFESPLRGSLAFDTNQGLDLNLRGERDRILVNLASDFEPLAIDIRRDQAIARGRKEGEVFRLALEQFPLIALNVRPAEALGLGAASGLASGDFTLRWAAQELEGTLAIDRPGLRPLQGDRFTANLRYANGVGTLSQGRLVEGENELLLDATLVPGADPQFSGRLVVAQAQIGDVFRSLEAIDFTNLGEAPPPLGSAADLDTVPVGLPEAPLLLQLQRLAEIDALIAQQQEIQNGDGLLALGELEGLFRGAIQFSGSLQAGIQADFDLQGQDFTLGDYAIDEVVATGDFRNGTLELSPLLLATDNRRAIFRGQFAEQRQSGQLQLTNIPLEPLNDLVELPFAVTGDLDGTATLAGGLANPQVQGSFSLSEATLNGSAVQSAQARFTYDQARLNFDSRAVIANLDPLSIDGSIPYRLPFAEAEPASDQIIVNASVRNDGLGLINLLTDQIAWVEGQGSADLAIRGTLDEPEVQGLIALRDAQFTAPALPDPLTNVSGSIQFDRDRIIVPALTGLYSEGQIAAQGRLAIFDSVAAQQAAQSEPLTVLLESIDLDLRGLYRGQVDGNLVITGSLLQPELGGIIGLSNGQVLLADVAGGTGGNGNATNGLSNGLGNGFNGSNGFPLDEPEDSIQFRGLQVQLGDNIRISQPPVLSFLASGDVTLNGSFNAPRPEGLIQFQRGSINLFTSRFQLDRRQDNVARFDPAFGLDPYLNIAMITTVTEATRGRTTILNEFADLPVGTLGSIESVRVRAQVDGRASELVNNFGGVVALSSSPNRTDSEIVALLGGGVAESIAEGDAELALANIASSAFLTTATGFLSDLLGARATFRIFPVLIPNSNNRDRSVLQLGAEFGYDVTDRFSVSVLQVLTGLDEPTLFNLSYDINDQFRIRGGVNTDGDALGILEYRLRF
ncbi:DUF748 domain-containing protein [Synechococcales cyanobacterium C]|uniref:DUF748 domain-containing protein n=1 Tax=Petrachloros mirabilis ULC683 TaxID=2781853 RepID=A0A8K2A7H1_9CYAN|nr:translocation/assembly module TamB [Petrachloros mirabilis]NCJ06919.1 DUF748 domain-containing protein [Petrachloros mirabilis ULC683]